MRTSKDTYKDGKLWNGYDYEKQEWVFEGKKDTRSLEELRAVKEPKCNCPKDYHKMFDNCRGY